MKKPGEMVFVFRLQAKGDCDEVRIRYYEALRTLFGITVFVGGVREFEKKLAAGQQPGEPIWLRWLMKRFVKRLTRRFQTLTGVHLSIDPA